MIKTKMTLTIGLIINEFFALTALIGLLYIYATSKNLQLQIDQLILSLVIIVLAGVQIIHTSVQFSRKNLIPVYKGFFSILGITLVGGTASFFINSLWPVSSYSEFAYIYISFWAQVIFVTGLLTIIIASLLSLTTRK